MCLKRFTSLLIESSPLFHEVNYLWHCVLLDWFMLNIGSTIVGRQNYSPESDVSKHEGKPTECCSIGNLFDGEIFDPHLYQLLPHFELHFR